MKVLLTRTVTPFSGLTTVFDSSVSGHTMSWVDKIHVFLRTDTASATDGLKVLTRAEGGASFNFESTNGVHTVPAGTASVPHHTYIVEVSASEIKVTYQPSSLPGVFELEIFAEFSGDAKSLYDVLPNAVAQDLLTGKGL